MNKLTQCNHHIVDLRKGKSHFINVWCKLCDQYLKHASHYEQEVWKYYEGRNQHYNVTFTQLKNEALELRSETFHLDPEKYIDAFGPNVVWLNISYHDKEEAKQYKPIWEPRLRMWYTYIDHPQAHNLTQWMRDEDLQRLYDHITEQQQIQDQYKEIIERKQQDTVIKFKKKLSNSQLG